MPSTVKRSASASRDPLAGRRRRRRRRQQHGELVAAEAGDMVAGAQRGPMRGPSWREHAVAGVVAERVVELLEVVEVDHEQRERAVRVLARAVDRAAQLAVEPAAVRQAGQLVGARLAAGLGEPAQLVDADRGADHRDHQRAAGEADRDRRQRRRGRRTTSSASAAEPRRRTGARGSASRPGASPRVAAAARRRTPSSLSPTSQTSRSTVLGSVDAVRRAGSR